MTLDLGIIRRQRYVSNATAANVTSSTYAQGGTITSYTYSGTTYIAHIFTVTGFFTVTSTIDNLEFLAVAGGGGGGQAANGGGAGGGGGGGIVNGSSLVTINRAYASSAYLAVTTSTQVNVIGGWVDGLGQTDFTGRTGSFLYSWSAVQQTNGGARTMPLMDAGAYHNLAPQCYYMEIGITYVSPANVGIGLIRDGAPLSGWANLPYINLSTGVVAGFQGVSNVTLGAFQPGDTLQIAWNGQFMTQGLGTYWWVGRNNTWNSTPLSDTGNAGISTGTYKTGALRMIFMCTAAGGGTMRGQFRSGLENKFAPPIPNTAPAFTFTNYTGYYTNPLGTGYITSNTTFGVTIGAGGGTGIFNPGSTIAGANGNNGGDTIIYSTNNVSSYYSAYFANSLITATNSAFSFGTADFSIETWMYPTSSYGRNISYNYRPIFDSRDFNNRAGDVPDRGFIVYLGLYNNVGIYTSGTTYLTTVNTVTNAAWSHVAVARVNGVMNIWINGIKDRTVFVTTSTAAFHNFTNTNIRIGYGSIAQGWTDPSFYTGYLSNYRIVNGVSAYNPGILGVNAPLTATQNASVNGNPSIAISGTSTSLLMLTTSTTGILNDTSLGNTATLTNVGTVTAVGIGPGTYSGSLSFSGTGQYLTNAGSRAFTFGTDNFTVEYWVYYNATNGTFQHAVGNATSSVGYAFGIATNYLYITTVSVGYSALTAIIKIQQWLHIAFARSGTNINVYMNGSWVWTFSNMVDNITETGFGIGARSNGTFLINGYLSNIRVVKGIALYTHTGNFTPPTTVTSATQAANVYLTGPANLPSFFAVNTITTQTVLLAFNTATIGNASTLTIALNQTSGTVTVSTFAPFTTSTEIVRAFGGGGGGGTNNNGSSGGSGGGASGGGTNLWGGTPIPGQGKAGGQGSQSLGSGGGGYSTTGGPALNEGTWPVTPPPAGAGGDGGYFNHSGAMIAYSGGGGGGSWSSNLWTVGPGGVGGGGNGAYYALVTGYLTSATSGAINSGGGGGAGHNTTAPNYYAAPGGSGIVIFRYPAFLGDAARFPTGLTDPYLKNTTLLLSGQYGQNTGTNNTIIDSSYNMITINTATVTIAQGTFSPYGPLWSTSFNGSTDYLTFVSTGTRFALNSFFGLNKSFTIEAWINPNAVQLSNTATVILGDASPTGSGLAWSVGVDASNKPIIYWNDAVGRNFITATNALSTGTWNHVAWVSYAGTPTIFVNGILLPSNASVSTTLTNATQTLGIVIGAHWNRFYNGSISNLRVSTNAIYNTPTATSVYLNGSSYLTSATSTAMVFGTSNFTIEFWVYWFVSPGGTPQYVVGKAATPNGLVVGGFNGNWYMSTSNVGYTTSVAFNLNQWYHVAVVRNSGSMTLYVDGISRYTTAFATSITETGVNVGTYLGTVNSTPNAVISNIRILNGTALYTGSPFTVPTPNLTNITNTTLLTFVTTSTFLDYSSSPTRFTIVGTPAFVGLLPPSISTSSFILPVTPFNTPANTILLTNNSNRFIDISTSSISITTGTITSIPRVQRQSPFTLGYPYTPLTIGNSVSLNGTSDYLSFISIVPPAIEYLVVAGGGGGGSADNSAGGGGGGGAGGLLTAAGFGVTAGTPIIVTVGAGGTGRANNTALGGGNGTESVFGSITAIGGGGGGTFATPGGLGGSGGGAFGRASQLGGAGTAGPPRQGNDGSPSFGGALGAGFGGTGGGGATAQSAPNSNANGTAGGAGAASSISGTSVTYAGGGGGGGGTGAGTGGAGGTGGGGAGGRSAVNAVAGTTNSGGGGGGSGVISSGANGGSGVVIIRYSDSFPVAAATVGSPTYTVSGGYRIYTFTSSGSITFDNVTPVPSLPLQLDSDFTIESWIYTTSAAAQCIFDLAGISGNSLRPNSFALNIGTAGVLFFSYSNTTSPNSIRGITPYTWNHIAVTRASDVMSVWQNGSLTLSVTSSTNFSNGALIIGRNGPTAASYFSGYISDFRIVKGQVLYNSTFNPPVAPLKPIDNTTSTSLLLNFNNVSIIDASMNQNITIINTATTASNIVKYNPKTMYFPGVSDYLTITPVSITSYALGTSDFTVEMWIYVLPFPGWRTTNLQPATIRSIFDMRTTNTANAGFDIFLSAAGILNVSTFGTTYISGTTPITVNTWHHVALVRQSNTFTLYLNGFTEGIYSSATPNFINPITRIGFGAAGGGYFNGYIDEVRVTRGVARYTTATFLVSQKALPVK